MTETNLPKYKKIVNDILAKIHAGEYPPQSRLPSENQMAKIYSASVPTIRRAMAELVYREIIYRIQGNGTFVGAQSPEEEKIPNTPSMKRNSLNISFLLLADASDNSVMKMIRGAQKYLFEKGYTMSIVCGDEKRENESQLMRDCMQTGVEGIIWFAARPEESLDSLRLLTDHNIPVVILDRGISEMPYTLVSCYNLDGGYQMTRYLLELGHRKILFAADRFDLKAEKDRYKGYCQAHKEKLLPLQKSLIMSNLSQDEQLDELVKLIKSDGITAIQCVNDKIALRIMRRLEREGINVPNDISVSGFDGSDESEYSFPRITTMNQPFMEMGRIAASRLLGMMTKKMAHTQTFLSVELAIKESTAAPKGIK